MSNVPDTKKYDNAYSKFKKAINTFIVKLQKKLDDLTIKTVTFNSNRITLKDNTIYQYNGPNGLTNLTIVFPKGNFTSTVLFSTAREGEITITFKGDNVSYVGFNELRFFNSENWELNIQNGRIVGNQIFRKK